MTSVQGTKTQLGKPVRIICPKCKKDQQIMIPTSYISDSPGVTTISIPEDLICTHHFQVFIDKNYSVRGYQKVDHILTDLSPLDEQQVHQQPREFDKELFENLFLEGNFVAWSPPKNTEKPLEIFTSNHDKLIQYLLESITTLNERFNSAKSESLKSDIRFSINLLEEFLEIEAKSTKEIHHEEFNSLLQFIEITSACELKILPK